MRTNFWHGVCVISAIVGSAQGYAQNLYGPPQPARVPLSNETNPSLPGNGGGEGQPGTQPGSQPGTQSVPPSNPPPISNGPGSNATGEAAPQPLANPAAPQLAAVSLFAVIPPPPKRYAKHDLVEVIINESSIQSLSQTQDDKKTYDMSAQLSKFPSLHELFANLALKEGIGSAAPAVGIKSNNQYKGEGKFDRKDQVTAKITATVIDVKPNGNLVLEARESITSDKEVSTMVLSGTCRADDITKSNTMQSSQLAGLTIRIEHEGSVKDTADKGLIPRIFETIFNF